MLGMIPLWKKEPWYFRAEYYYFNKNGEEEYLREEISGYFEEN